MDVEKVFHMTGGAGDSSYTKNSSLQKKGSDMVKHITMGAIQQLYLTTSPKSIGIADLGCSSGTNSLSTIREMVDAIEETNRSKVSQPLPEFRVYLNDLPTNDFNAVFKALPDFYRELKQARIDQGSGPSIYIAGYPGSFYGRLFPTDCLHFIYSSYSLHWLSRVPPALYDEQGMSINKGNIYISESSPPEVSEAYFKQFQEDFSLFLRSRSEELIAGGRMVLILLGRIGSNHVDRGNSLLWKLLTQSLTILVSQSSHQNTILSLHEKGLGREEGAVALVRGEGGTAVVVVDKSGVAVRAEKRRGRCNCGWGREKGWLEVTKKREIGLLEFLSF
ncbi:salicylate carboxymethyltransferase-like [Camellia sinensis]|uniref:salicylate carboxymethyltransferase-like n=1 Tax=Camellia sinensis TaxID=4442 RepID=UPI00103560C6|nr:salicylate carboxymethyltransferase-like [Camellia sinensis]